MNASFGLGQVNPCDPSVNTGIVSSPECLAWERANTAGSVIYTFRPGSVPQVSYGPPASPGTSTGGSALQQSGLWIGLAIAGVVLFLFAMK